MATSTVSSTSTEKPALVPRGCYLAFALVTSLFALWGFANDVTNPLVKAFKDVFVISNTQSALVQTAFYGGYFTMALPAALFIRRYSYKAGIIVGLALYAIGAFISIPAAANANFDLFLVALYVLTFGLAFLETTANPLVLSMGPPETATQRLNFAQAFNPIGSLTGMAVSSFLILTSLQVSGFRADVKEFRNSLSDPSAMAANIDPHLGAYLKAVESERAATPEDDSLATYGYDRVLEDSLAAFKAGRLDSYQGQTFAEMQSHDLEIIKMPYVVIGCVVLAVMGVFLMTRIPDTHPPDSERLRLGETFAKLMSNMAYLEGVAAQMFYVGAQIMCWTFIIHYGTTNLGLSSAEAQNYNIVAMVIFCSSRFVCTFLLRFISPGRLLTALAIGAIGFSCGTIFIPGYGGLYSLVGISACMSLMFPTIYGIALDGMGDEAKIASAGLIMAIVGGALMPPLQGRIIDMGGESGRLAGLPAVSVSFVLPLVCFLVVAAYGLRTMARSRS